MPREALTAEDLAILRAESATIAGHTCKAIVGDAADAPPTLADVQELVESRLARVPRCCEHLVLEPSPAWSGPGAVSIEDHVRLAPEGDDLRAAVARAMAGRLDRGRPLWDIELLPDIGGGWALVWRVHHCMADGMTMMRWASDLFWDDAPEPTTIRAPKPIAAPERRAAAWTAGARTALSVLREVRPSRRPGPFAGRVGRRRDVAFASCRLDDLRAIEHAAGEGVTMNDVVLAAVAGALRRWCVLHGAPLDGARVKVPVSMHTGGSHPDDLGNRDSFMFVDLPVGEPDPATRLRAVNQETRERKTHHDAEAVYDVLAALSRVAPPLAQVAGRFLANPREFTLNVSNVPGPKSEVRVLGRRVERLYSFAEVAERHPVRIAAVSLDGTMYFGLCADADVVSGVDTLAEGIEASVAELRTT